MWLQAEGVCTIQRQVQEDSQAYPQGYVSHFSGTKTEANINGLPTAMLLCCDIATLPDKSIPRMKKSWFK